MIQKKVFGQGIIIQLLAVVLIFAFTACDGDNGGTEEETGITYPVTQIDGVANTADTTGITFVFSDSIDALGINANDITLTGVAEKGAAQFTGSGVNWTLSPITINSAGSVSVIITKDGVSSVARNVNVFKAESEQLSILGTWIADFTPSTSYLGFMPNNVLKIASATGEETYTYTGTELTITYSELGASSGNAIVDGNTIIISGFTGDWVILNGEYKKGGSLSLSALPFDEYPFKVFVSKSPWSSSFSNDRLTDSDIVATSPEASGGLNAGQGTYAPLKWSGEKTGTYNVLLESGGDGQKIYKNEVSFSEGLGVMVIESN